MRRTLPLALLAVSLVAAGVVLTRGRGEPVVEEVRRPQASSDPIQATAVPIHETALPDLKVSESRLRISPVTPPGHEVPEGPWELRLLTNIAGKRGSILHTRVSMRRFGDEFVSEPIPSTSTYDQFQVPGFEAVEREIRTQPQTEFDLGLVSLKPLPWISGRVVDGEGEPVSGATVYREPTSRGRFRLDVNPFADEYYSLDAADLGETRVRFKAVAKTSANGSFRLTGVNSGETPIHIEAEGFVPWSRRITSGSSVLVRMEKGARLHGVLRDAKGLPRAGNVYLYASPGEGVATGDVGPPIGCISAGKDGRWSGRVSPGRYFVGHRWPLDGERYITTVEVAEGEQLELEITAPPRLPR